MASRVSCFMLSAICACAVVLAAAVAPAEASCGAVGSCVPAPNLRVPTPIPRTASEEHLALVQKSASQRVQPMSAPRKNLPKDVDVVPKDVDFAAGPCREAEAGRPKQAPEKAWKNAGKKKGMQIWRIEKFKLKASKTARGTFYDDDSYICLNTYLKKNSDKLAWDIHFWLGSTTSQDEAGTAAYKTVELDDFLGGEPVQHREVSGFESQMFLEYFKDVGGIRLLEGGVESGFNSVKPEEYKPHLLQLTGEKEIRSQEVPMSMASLNTGDVFILDDGLLIYMWQGKESPTSKVKRGGELCRALDSEREGKPEVIVFRQGDTDQEQFFSYFSDFKSGDDQMIREGSVGDWPWENDSTKMLYRLTISSVNGKLKFTEVASKIVRKSMLHSDDVFVLDIGSEVFVWVGKGAALTLKERMEAMKYGQDYLKVNKRPSAIPLSVIHEGSENKVFDRSFESDK